MKILRCPEGWFQGTLAVDENLRDVFLLRASLPYMIDFYRKARQGRQVKKVFFAFFAGLAVQMYGRELRANLAHHLLVVARDHREISHEQLVNYIIACIHQ